MSSGVNVLSPRLPFALDCHLETQLTRLYKLNSPIPCPSSAQTQLTPSQSRLGELTQSQTPRLGHLSSCSDIKSPRIDKSYLLRLPCTKLMVMVKMLPINSIADLETHIHVIHATLQHGLFTPYYVVISDWQLERGLSYKDVNRYGNSLRPTYNVTLFRYWQHHGITRRRCLTGLRRNHGRRSSDSL